MHHGDPSDYGAEHFAGVFCFIPGISFEHGRQRDTHQVMTAILICCLLADQ